MPFTQTLSPETKNYTVQQLINGTTLNITLIASSVRRISGAAVITASLQGPSMFNRKTDKYSFGIVLAIYEQP